MLVPHQGEGCKAMVRPAVFASGVAGVVLRRTLTAAMQAKKQVSSTRKKLAARASKQLSKVTPSL